MNSIVNKLGLVGILAVVFGVAVLAAGSIALAQTGGYTDYGGWSAYTWGDPAPQSSQSYAPYCGNNIVEWPEQCDQGTLNGTAGSSCSWDCRFVSNPSGPACGNFIVEFPEQCDDGNALNGDGCSASCRIETGNPPPPPPPPPPPGSFTACASATATATASCNNGTSATASATASACATASTQALAQQQAQQQAQANAQAQAQANASASCGPVNPPPPPPPPPPAGQLTCNTLTPNVRVGEVARFSASDTSGSWFNDFFNNFSWVAFEGNPSTGSGSTFQTTFFSQGTKTVTVSRSGRSANCTVQVAPFQGGNPTLVISPSSHTINVGAQFQFTAFFDPDGPSGSQPQQNVTQFATWSANPASVASQVAPGRFQGIAAGSANIQANYSDLTANATLNVNAVPPPPPPPTPDVTCNTFSNTQLVGQFVNVFAQGGNGLYAWSALSSEGASITSGGPGPTFSTIYSTAGNKTITVVSGGKSSTCSVTIVPVSTGNLSCSANPSNVNVNQNVTFTAVNGATASYSWSAPDGTPSSATNVGSTFTNSYATPGVKTVTVTNGGQSSQCTVNVTSQNVGQIPSTQTNNAINISQNSATVTGQVNPNGAAATYWFEYGTTQSLGNQTPFQSLNADNSFINVNAGLFGLAPNTTYYFRVVAQNQYGVNRNAQILSFTTSGFNNCQGCNVATVQTYPATGITPNSALLNGQITTQFTGGYPGNYNDTQVWFEYGINPNLMNLTTNPQFIGNTYSQNFSAPAFNLVSGTNYFFRAVARSSGGFTYGQTLSFNTPGGGYPGPIPPYPPYPPYPGVQQPQVTTLPATLVFQNSSLLNGQVNPNGGVTSAWFEYGPTPALGLRTPDQPIGNANTQLPYAAVLSGLLPNTTYYFKAVAQNQFGIGAGQVLTFTTTGGGITPPPTGGPTPAPQPPIFLPPQVIIGGTGGATANCVSVAPTMDVTRLDPGDEFNYTVTYRNGCNFTLNNAVLRVFLPSEVEFLSSSNPYFTREGNHIFYNLGPIPPNGQAAVTIRGLVKNTTRIGDTLIFSSNLEFTDGRGAFQTVSSYLTVTLGVEGGILGASIIDAFRNAGWLWWLLLILLILLLFFWALSRIMRRDRNVTVQTDNLKGLRI